MSRTRRVRSRGRIAAVLALVGALAVAGDVIAGGSNRTVVRDPVSNIEEGCDIRKATSKLTNEGRLRHTITLRLATGSLQSHRVTISRNRSGGADLVLADGVDGVDARLADNGKRVVLEIRRGRVAQAVDSLERYFWVARSCMDPGDRAPNRGNRARQSL